MVDDAKIEAQNLSEAFREAGYGAKLHKQSVPPHGWAVIVQDPESGHNMAYVVVDDQGHIMVDWDKPEGFVRDVLKEYGLAKYLVEDMPGPKFRTLEIIGRRWFQRTYGNTYHTAEIIIDGDLVHKTPKAYGYGDQYVQSAAEWLVRKGYLSPLWAGKPLWQIRDDLGIKYRAQAIDVSRERDL